MNVIIYVYHWGKTLFFCMEVKMRVKRLLAILFASIFILQSGTVFALDTIEENSKESSTVDLDCIAQGICGENMSWILDNNGLLTISGEVEMASKIPWRSYNDQIKSIVINNGVTTIAKNAFSNCRNLLSVSLPDTLKEINDQAFEDCEKLNSIVIPDSVQQLGFATFQRCHSLSNVHIGKNVKVIPNSSFSSCTTLESIVVPANVTTIEGNAFVYCINLKRATIKNIHCDIYYGMHIFYLSNPIICGYKGSTAERYAEQNKLVFEALDPCTHNYPSRTITNEPSCLDQGKRIFYCTNCDSQTKTEMIPALGHDFSGWDVISEPTCTEAGLKYRYCNRNGCNETDYKFIPELGHKLEKEVVTEATCVYSGDKRRYCIRENCKYYEFTELIDPKGHTWKKRRVIRKATPNSSGEIELNCAVCHEEDISNYYFPSDTELYNYEYVYNGKKHHPLILIFDDEGEVIPELQYKVTYSKNTKDVGTHYVYAKFDNKYYKGTIKRKFRIFPKATSLRTPISGTRCVTVKWNKQTTQTSGYRIRYATNSKFKNAKYISIWNNRSTSRRITGLSSRKKYYIQIQTIKKINSTAYCSSWSATKVVRTK